MLSALKSLRRFLRYKNGVVGAIIVLMVGTIAAFAPILSPHNYIESNLRDAFLAPGEDSRYPLGTDNVGRDIMSRIFYGARVSLLAGIFAQLVNTIIGGTLGVIGGWFGGIVDDVISFWTNVTLSIPVLIFALALLALTGPGLQNLIIALGVTNWCYTARVARAQTLSAKERDYVQAAKAIGCSHFRILAKHIVPNIVTPIIVIGTLGIGDAILLISSLGFLGMGVQPPMPEWGTMLSKGRMYIFQAPWICIFPGLAILLTVLGFNLLGDGLRDLIDPYMKKHKMG